MSSFNNTGFKKNPNSDRPHGNKPRRDGDRPQKVVGFGSLDRLVDLHGGPAVTRRPPQPQPEPLVFTGDVNAWYKTERNGHESKIFLVEVKKDQATYKNDPNDKHSQTMSLAKFLKFYKADA